jgi:hypothetical protein
MSRLGIRCHHGQNGFQLIDGVSDRTGPQSGRFGVVSGNATYRPERTLIHSWAEMNARLAAMMLAVVSLPLAVVSCGSTPPKRPTNVPAAATFASGGKVGWWHYCKFDTNDNQAHCTIWNEAGLVLYEGVFLPSDHGLLTADELKIVYNERWGDNAQFICLPKPPGPGACFRF